MSQLANEPILERPPVNQDVAPPQTVGSRFKVPTSSLRAYTLLFALLGVWAFFQYATDGIFLESRNFSNLMRQTAVTGVLAVGMLMVIVAGQIDLSVGSVVGLAGGVAAIAQGWLGWGLVPTLLAALAIGLIIGLAQGALVAYFNIPAFIVTLGGLLAWRGAIKGLSVGNTIPIGLESFKAIGQDYVAPSIGYGIAAVAIAGIIWLNVRRLLRREAAAAERTAAQHSGINIIVRTVVPSVAIILFVFFLNSYNGIPVPVIILLAVALTGAFLTKHTTFGRYLYAIGGNPEAARLSGINLRAHILAVFGLIGGLAGVAAILYTARVAAAAPDAGTLLELDAIAACVIGGASLMGGRGTIFGVCLGALFMASLDNGMSLDNYKDYTQDIVKGAILVLAVGLDMLGQRRG